MTKGLQNSRILHILLLIVIGLLAYSNTFHASFHLDDERVIVRNPIIKDLKYFINPSEARQFNGHFEYPSFRSRYISYLTFALNYRLHGLDVKGYHAVNIVIHICNALLIYFLVLLTFRTPAMKEIPLRDYEQYIALYTALLFVAHPIQTEAVTYVWQRIASLSAFFYLLSVILFIKWRLRTQSTEHRQQNADNPPNNPRAGRKQTTETTNIFSLKSVFWYIGSVFSAVLAMNTKETAFTLPAVIIIYDILFFRGGFSKRVPAIFPFLFTMLIVPLNHMTAGITEEGLISRIGSTTRFLTDISRTDYLLTQFRVIMTYLRLIFLPVNQNLDYDYKIYTSITEPEVFLSFIFLSGLSLLALWLVRSGGYRRLAGFGLLWFFITISVESSIIPLINLICEYRVYLPSAGLFLVITVAVFKLAEKFKYRWAGINIVAVALLCIVTLILAFVSYSRNRVWKDEISLWSDVAAKSPDKARGHSNLGSAFLAERRYDNAREEYLTAIRVDPGYAIPYNNLAYLYQYHYKGLIDRAIENYKKALELKPDIPEAYFNLGNAYMEKGLADKAINEYISAISLRPAYVEAHYNLGNAYMSKSLSDDAIEHYQLALKLSPGHPGAHYNIGIAFKMKGMPEKALEHLKTARRLNPALFQKKNKEN